MKGHTGVEYSLASVLSVDNLCMPMFDLSDQIFCCCTKTKKILINPII